MELQSQSMHYIKKPRTRGIQNGANLRL